MLKNREFTVVVYKKDLSTELNKILFSSSVKGLKEFFYILHSDSQAEHYHIYLNYDKPVFNRDVKALFFKTVCFISPLSERETPLGVLYYFTEGFRLPFDSSYSLKPAETVKNKE